MGGKPYEMCRHDSYWSNSSCSPETLVAGLRPDARRARGGPSNRSRPVTNSAVPSGRPLPSARRGGYGGTGGRGCHRIKFLAWFILAWFIPAYKKPMDLAEIGIPERARYLYEILGTTWRTGRMAVPIADPLSTGLRNGSLSSRLIVF
jgi:hypothetical protein